jgi:hypothetical protein
MLCWFGQRAAQIAVWAAVGISPTVAYAQVPGRCSVISFTDPPREVLRCRDRLIVEVEKDTRYQLIDRDRDGLPDAAEVGGRAVLLDGSSRRRGGFQVLTPHAIASVRGTIYAVDVQSGQTAVFVAQGRVSVSTRDGSSSVLLSTGEGVDVQPGRPLEVKTWGVERAKGLLARFGR